MDALWKNLKFLKHEPIIYVISIINLIVVPERRIGDINLLSPLVLQAMVNVSAA
jgi:hypothetical protein